MEEPTLKTKNALLKMQNPQTIKKQLLSNKVITDTCIALFTFININNNEFSEIEHDLLNTFKISTLKSVSIMNSAQNFKYECDYDNLTITDPFSTWCLVRAQFESYCNFNNICIQQNSEEEKELKYLAWKISGLKNRQTFSANTEEHIDKKEAERLEIEDIKSKIALNTVFNSLTGGLNTVSKFTKDKNKWQIVINSNSATTVGWQDLLENSGVNFSGFSKFYTYLSILNHPTYISSIQFKDIYYASNNEEVTRLALDCSNIIMSLFIMDLCNYSEKIKNYFDTLPELNRTLVGIYSGFRTHHP